MITIRFEDTALGSSARRKHIPTSTVGRGGTVKEIEADEIEATAWSDDLLSVKLGDSLQYYQQWDMPTVIVSDGGYGVLGFEGDTPNHLTLPEWYEPHIAAWAKRATPSTTLWFWNSEIGWAAVHPILEKYGWRYVNANIWNKGKAHIAGNVHTAKIRRLPVVSEMCVQYVYEARLNGLELHGCCRNGSELVFPSLKRMKRVGWPMLPRASILIRASSGISPLLGCL